MTGGELMETTWASSSLDEIRNVDIVNIVIFNGMGTWTGGWSSRATPNEQQEKRQNLREYIFICFASQTPREQFKLPTILVTIIKNIYSQTSWQVIAGGCCLQQLF